MATVYTASEIEQLLASSVFGFKLGLLERIHRRMTPENKFLFRRVRVHVCWRLSAEAGIQHQPLKTYYLRWATIWEVEISLRYSMRKGTQDAAYATTPVKYTGGGVSLLTSLVDAAG